MTQHFSISIMVLLLFTTLGTTFAQQDYGGEISEFSGYDGFDDSIDWFALGVNYSPLSSLTLPLGAKILFLEGDIICYQKQPDGEFRIFIGYDLCYYETNGYSPIFLKHEKVKWVCAESHYDHAVLGFCSQELGTLHELHFNRNVGNKS